MTVVVDELHSVHLSVGIDAEDRATDLRHRAATELIALLVLAALIAIAALDEAMLLVASSRSVMEPLAVLAREADDIASRRLPQAVAGIQADPDNQPPPDSVRVPAHASAEIRKVVDALDNIQQAVRAYAIDQTVARRNSTESLAKLAQRNQDLLHRQLSFISRLEREEADPDTLGNLFELDHLATRMRRNAECLLVLAGKTSPRRHTAPVPVADAVRAAVAEVEEYRRVELRGMEDAYVVGTAVTDVAHMIAELIENGLAFSSPELDVEIHGRWIGDQYLIVIVDNGVGMSDEDFAVANARLRGDERFLPGPASFLGHYVVGRLAQELGCSVQLSRSPMTGVTARLVLPPPVVSAGPGRTQPKPQADPLQHGGTRLSSTPPRPDLSTQPVLIRTGPVIEDTHSHATLYHP